jgi:hypothetical protein
MRGTGGDVFLMRRLPGELRLEFERMSTTELTAAVTDHLPSWSAMFANRGDPRLWGDLHKWPADHQHAVVELYDDWRAGRGIWQIISNAKAAA